MLLFVILAAQLMVVLDTTIVNVALPHIQQGLGFSASGLSWVLNAYILTFGGLLLLGARAGDLLGRRRVFLAGIALFTLSSLAGGLAASGWMLLGARGLQGIGAALAAPSALSLLTTAFPEGQARVRAIGLYTTVSAAGGAVGLVAGGLLTDLVSWRWVMFVNVPIGLVVWTLGRIVIAESRRRPGRFDFVGALTSTLGMTGFVFGLVEAGIKGWGSPLPVASLAAGVALLGLFVHNEGRVDEPILPLRLLAHTTRSAANLARGLLYAGMYGMFFYLSQFLQDVQRFSPLVAGIAFLPMPASVFLSSQLTGRVLIRRLPQKSVMMIGASLVTFGLLLATQIQAVDFLPPDRGLDAAGRLRDGNRVREPHFGIVGRGATRGRRGGLRAGQCLPAARSGSRPRRTRHRIRRHHETRPAQYPLHQSLRRRPRDPGLVHGLDDIFALGALFAVAALAMVMFGIRPARQAAQAPVVAVVAPEESNPWLEREAG